VQIVEKVDGEVVDIERINFVRTGADLGLLLSSAHERWRPSRKQPISAQSRWSLIGSAT
jgi:hypothetical protein